MDKLYWTKKIPGKSGWYWVKQGKKKRASITYVTKADIKVGVFKSDFSKYSYFCFVKYWAGPIPFPRDAMKDLEAFSKRVFRLSDD